MTKPNDPAFPVSPSDYSAKHGLTKREYFAAMAMQGILTNEGRGDTSAVIRVAMWHADELIEKLNKTKDAE